MKPGDEVYIDVLAPGEVYHDSKFHFIVSVNGTTYTAAAPVAKGAANTRHTAEVITEVPSNSSALDMANVHYTYADYLMRGGKDQMPGGLRTVYPVTQHKIRGIYPYKYSPLQEAWVTPSNPFASLPSYGSAWKTDAFDTSYHHIGW